MQFSKDLAEKIMAGAKKQTRRPVKSGEHLFDVLTLPDGERTIGAVHTSSGRLKWRYGKKYAIQPGRGKRGVGQMKITRIRRQNVQDITEADAVKEGFASREGFIEKWQSLYMLSSYDWDKNPVVWVIDFEVVKDGQ